MFPRLQLVEIVNVLVTNFSLFQDLPIDLKGRNESKKICSSSLTSEFPDHCKLYPADTKDDLHKVMSVSSVEWM